MDTNCPGGRGGFAVCGPAGIDGALLTALQIGDDHSIRPVKRPIHMGEAVALAS